MKKLFIIIGLISSTGWSHAPLEGWDAYREHLEAKHLEGNEQKSQEALEQAEKWTKNGENPSLNNFVDKALSETFRSDDLRVQKAIRFLTGKKKETYCKAIGLVDLVAQHKDGTTSRIVLTRNQRIMGDEGYAYVKEGSWAYELSNGYRKPITSDLWMVWSEPYSFHMKERREGDTTRRAVETGEYKVSWSPDNNSYSVSDHTTGNNPEPFPMYMANSYHMWGRSNPTLGRNITFEVGKKDERLFSENAWGYRMNFKSTRIVSQKLPQFETQDSKGKVYNYSDCFGVDYEIEFVNSEKK